MKAGDEDDDKRYNPAAKSYEDQDGSCRRVSGTSTKTTQQPARCTGRGEAPDPVLAAAQHGMANRASHCRDRLVVCLPPGG